MSESGSEATDTVAVDSASVWPADAMDVDEGVVANWFVREGAVVSAGETLCEIQIEKVSVDVPAPVAGEVASVLVPENETFTRGDVLAELRPT
ncbi:lipoyl domain-containing protein [Halorarius litoreus]|uniref:lipoyl domain-containing protein n=1 Tax=Halorarius litoreus TaxID=2962676 RepID=UPI0020CE8039|nr:lipoyl domain-containing protein [Halorarius litoreus]